MKHGRAAESLCFFVTAECVTNHRLQPELPAGSTLQQIIASQQLPTWRGNVKNLDAQAAILWGQVMRAVQVSGYNLVAPPGARGVTADWVREGIRMQRWHLYTSLVLAVQIALFWLCAQQQIELGQSLHPACASSSLFPVRGRPL